MNSEDSSSEEDVSKFAEAVDVQFAQCFSSRESEAREKKIKFAKKEQTLPPSLRKPEDTEDFSQNKLSLKVTPEFQKFVAKKLEQSLDCYLDECLEDSTSHLERKKKKKKKHKNNAKEDRVGEVDDSDEKEEDNDIKEDKRNKEEANVDQSSRGIQLFKSSNVIEEFLEDDEIDKRTIQHNRNEGKRKVCDEFDDDDEELKKIRSVVIESDVILSQSETKAWSKNVKGEVVQLEKTKERNVFKVQEKGYVPP